MRPLRLTPALTKNIEQLIRNGCVISDVCKAVGIGTSSYYEWLNAGKAIHEGDKENPYLPSKPRRRKNETDEALEKRREQHEEKRQLLLTFYIRISAAEAMSMTDMVAMVRSAAISGDWKAAAWFLERRDPDNWSLRHMGREKIELSGEVTTNLRIENPAFTKLFQVLGHRERERNKDLISDGDAALSDNEATKPEVA